MTTTFTSLITFTSPNQPQPRLQPNLVSNPVTTQSHLQPNLVSNPVTTQSRLQPNHNHVSNPTTITSPITTTSPITSPTQPQPRLQPQRLLTIFLATVSGSPRHPLPFDAHFSLVALELN
ncbi:hypothetical protein Pcinc_020728 [Petrolisthes cinctipes]|uniref:Uncharacterized protein n=1 Tax=Petrolisthes cinctipes TaxID=88211 RepID=A0AAE1KG23_PETCI|nr:hypothetical protein Pcinc_020728 [Petrolisthes cinctipes]